MGAITKRCYASNPTKTGKTSLLIEPWNIRDIGTAFILCHDGSDSIFRRKILVGLKIIFAGTPSFALAPLTALVSSEHEVIAVYTQPDRPAGRGRKFAESPVKQFAKAHEIPVFQPISFKEAGAIRAFSELRPDIMVVVAYGLILPQTVLDIPRYGCVNIHASLLPAWRGAAPIQRALIAGDEVTGVTIMQMNAGLDTGDILSKASCAIDQRETSQSLHDKLTVLGSTLLLGVLRQVQEGVLKPVPQDDAKATLAPKINKSEAVLDFSDSVALLDRKIRAFSGWPVAKMQLDGEEIRVWEAEPLDDFDEALLLGKQPGDILQKGKAGIDIRTGDGVLRLLEVQRPGGRAMPVLDFLNANR